MLLVNMLQWSGPHYLCNPKTQHFGYHLGLCNSPQPLATLHNSGRAPQPLTTLFYRSGPSVNFSLVSVSGVQTNWGSVESRQIQRERRDASSTVLAIGSFICHPSDWFRNTQLVLQRFSICLLDCRLPTLVYLSCVLLICLLMN